MRCAFHCQKSCKLFLQLYSALRSPPEVQFIDLAHEIDFSMCAYRERTGWLCLFVEEQGVKKQPDAQLSTHRWLQMLNSADGYGFFFNITVVFFLNYIAFPSSAVTWSSPWYCVPSFGPYCCRPVWRWWTESIPTACFGLPALSPTPHPQKTMRRKASFLTFVLYTKCKNGLSFTFRVLTQL